GADLLVRHLDGGPLLPQCFEGGPGVLEQPAEAVVQVQRRGETLVTEGRRVDDVIERGRKPVGDDGPAGPHQSRCRASPVVRMDEQVDVAALPLCPHPQLRECRSLDHQRPDTSAGKQSLQVDGAQRHCLPDGEGVVHPAVPTISAPSLSMSKYARTNPSGSWSTSCSATDSSWLTDSGTSPSARHRLATGSAMIIGSASGTAVLMRATRSLPTTHATPSGRRHLCSP